MLSQVTGLTRFKSGLFDLLTPLTKYSSFWDPVKLHFLNITKFISSKNSQVWSAKKLFQESVWTQSALDRSCWLCPYITFQIDPGSPDLFWGGHIFDPLKEVCNVVMPLYYITFTFLNQDQILWSAGVLNWSFYVHQADRDVHSNNWVCRSKSKYCRFSFSDWVGCPSGAISQIGSQSAADLTCSPHNAVSETNTIYHQIILRLFMNSMNERYDIS